MTFVFLFLFFWMLSLRVWEIDFCILQQIQEYYPVNSPSLDSDARAFLSLDHLTWEQNQLRSTQLQWPASRSSRSSSAAYWPLPSESDWAGRLCLDLRPSLAGPTASASKVLLRPSCMVNSVLWTCSLRLCWILQRIYIILDLSLIL